MTFSSKLSHAQELTSSVVCVGLDPDPARFPSHLKNLPVGDATRHFCSAIIEATVDVACAYKPNLAFFEALGRDGLGILADVVSKIPNDRIIIADGKRGDIGNTSTRYAKAFFEDLEFDSVTVAPYMGKDSVEPFLAFEGKHTILLALHDCL